MADLDADLKWAVESLNRSNCDTCNLVKEVIEKHIKAIEKPIDTQSYGSLKKIPKNFRCWPEFEVIFADTITEIILAADQLEQVIYGIRDGPIITPVRKKAQIFGDNDKFDAIDEVPVINLDNSGGDKPRRKLLETSDEEFLFYEEAFGQPENPVETPNSEEIIKNIRANYSSAKVAELKEICREKNLDVKGKRQDLINRIVNQTISVEYGNTKIRSSYQTAMQSRVPGPSGPSSLQSNYSNAPTDSKTPRLKMSKNISKSTSRLQSPAVPNGTSSLHRTPSLRAKIKDSMQSTPIASPRPGSRTTRNTNLAKTPQQAEMEQREAARERKIKERKLQKEEEARRKKEEKAAHAEEIRKKKLRLEEEKKQKGVEKVFTSKSNKKPALKEKRAQLQAAREVEKKQAIEEAERVKIEEQRKKAEEEERQTHAENGNTPTPMNKNGHNLLTDYEVTPQGEDKWTMNPSTGMNYNIEDLESGDETDDDEKPRKVVPLWAKISSTQFKSCILRQYQSRTRYFDIFEAIDPNRPVDLTYLFEHMASSKALQRYKRARESSGKWVPMVEPNELIDRTLNLDHSTYPIAE